MRDAGERFPVGTVLVLLAMTIVFAPSRDSIVLMIGTAVVWGAAALHLAPTRPGARRTSG
jgi:hypothetical protein